MLNYLHKHIATILCFSAIAFVFTGMLFVTTETANADDNIVYKRCEIRYYYCLSAEFQNGTPIYSRASVATLGGMEDDDHPEYTDKRIYRPKPRYEWRGFPPFMWRVLVGFDWIYVKTVQIHNDHDVTVIWEPDKIYKFTDRYHWSCR